MTPILTAFLAIWSLVLWRRLAEANRRIASIRKIAEEHSSYVPDDLIGSPKEQTFTRASQYWSRMMVRVIDHRDA